MFQAEIKKGFYFPSLYPQEETAPKSSSPESSERCDEATHPSTRGNGAQRRRSSWLAGNPVLRRISRSFSRELK